MKIAIDFKKRHVVALFGLVCAVVVVVVMMMQ
jgi:hypothetical protein